ncbi:MAG: formyl transferase [Phenylobacterium sp.]|uniref:glucosamine inositolphosphorylceramide transferase family protein n=1 Tax=Phenylobacterium sp. TaxID=1871053 RepID=UPI001224899B|nr:hypothetical protein [Phenylobacterium sp.]TAJ73906.1 MAG: formyl transferase [Phenylobacterium sp.]
MPWRSDLWRIGLADAPIAAVAATGGLERATIRWLEPEPPFTFLADPFGLWRDGDLHLFAEAYDYRTRHGVIEWLRFQGGQNLAERRTVLRETWHLSYPFVFEAEGETWMAPEAHRSGRFTLYRAARFPDLWERAVTLDLDTPAIDPTIFRHGDVWWMAYSPAGSQSFKQGRLHLAWSEHLAGPWRTHSGNPVRIDRSSSRPGGTPFLQDGVLTLPVQDCSRTYGGAIRPLRILELAPGRFEAEAGPPLTAPASATPYLDGLHTLAGCGEVTLIDVKRIDRSFGGLAIDAGRRLGRWRT